MNINHSALEELIDSIRDQGLLQPIILKQTDDGMYEIEAGHRRYLSIKQLQWKEAPAIIMGKTDKDDIHLERAHENLIREDLSVLEEAKMVDALCNQNNRGVEETARLIKRSLLWIETRLDVLQYQDDIKEALANKHITLSSAKELTKCKDDEYRKKLIDYIIDTGANTKTIATWVKDADIKKFSDALECARETGIIQSVDLRPTYMECGICVSKLPVNELRHIFLCVTCMEGIRQIRADGERHTTKETKDE